MIYIVSETKPDLFVQKVKTDIIWLKPSNWDDYAFKTTFNLSHGRHLNGTFSFEEVGWIKIIKLNQSEGWTFNELKNDNLTKFDKLPSNYCSLSSDEDFYDKIKRILGEDNGVVLSNLNDVKYNPLIAEPFFNDRAFNDSLLRDSETSYLFREEYEKVIEGLNNEPLEKSFNASIKLNGADANHEIGIDFTKYADLPNRIFVLVGENGVGKTQILSRIAIMVSGYESVNSNYFKDDILEPRGLFRNVLSISFSAYDDFEIPLEDAEIKSSYKYCGVRNEQDKILSARELLEKSLKILSGMNSQRKEKFFFYLDKVFSNPRIAELLNYHNVYFPFNDNEPIISLLQLTSAGQRIVLATLINLIAYLKEDSLVIFDEPETHLHPSLLTTILSFMNELLDDYKSYAIISTHSPLVLQQVPSKYIKIIKRFENTPAVIDLKIETFGENLTEISQNVFDIHENERSHKEIFEELLTRNGNNPSVVEKMFNKGLGISAKSLLYSLASIRQAK